MPSLRIVSSIYLFAIISIIIILYHNSIIHTYLFADEFGIYRFHKLSIYFTLENSFNNHGRPISQFFYRVFGRALYIGENGITLIRIIQLLLSISAALISFRLLSNISVPRRHALLLIVFMWSQPAFAIHHAYFMLAPYWLGVLASLCTLHLCLNDYLEGRNGTKFILYSVLFLIGFLTYQASPFFVVGFVALCFLKNNIKNSKKYILILLALMSSMILYTLVFKILNLVYDMGSSRVEKAFDAYSIISAPFNAAFYTVFEFWNYIFPTKLDRSVKTSLIIFSAIVWIVVVLSAAILEIKRQPDRRANWIMAAICVALSFLPVVADGATGRQHVFLAAVPALSLTAYYSALVLLPEGTRARLYPLVLASLLIVAVGANFSYVRGLISPATRLFEYTRNSLAKFDETQFSEIRIRVPSLKEGRRFCPQDPCTRFYGRRLQIGHISKRKSLYRSVLMLNGQSPDVRIVFDSTPVPQDGAAFVVDWIAYMEREIQRSDRLKGD